MHQAISAELSRGPEVIDGAFCKRQLERAVTNTGLTPLDSPFLLIEGDLPMI